MTSAPSTTAPSGQPARRAYLIAGAGGMLGTALQRVLSERDIRYVAHTQSVLDITEPVSVRQRVGEFAASLAPGEQGVLINAAAYTNVERAEDEPEIAYQVNERGAALLARSAREAGLGFVHVSTDFVFDGLKVGAYTEADEPNPRSVYGASKLAGERAVAEAYPDAIIVRTAWVFGPAGVNFPVKILEFASSHATLSIVTDEVGSPTYTLDLAAGILGLANAGARGLFHLANGGSCSRYEMATEIMRFAGLERELMPVTAATFPSKAARPANSVLDCSRAASLGVTMPDWRSGLERFVAAR